MANGRVVTGFSKPYIADYSVSGNTFELTNPAPLARGVDVKITPENGSEVEFYADNQLAESDGGTFTSGTLDLTVDGLLAAAEKRIMGLPEAGQDGYTAYDDNQEIPYLAFGCVVRYMSAGVTSYVPIVVVKVKFNQPEVSAATQEKDINFQTQGLSAKIFRGDDANHTWKFIGTAQATENAAAESLLTKLGGE